MTAHIDLTLPASDATPQDVLEKSISIGVQNYVSGLLADLGFAPDVRVGINVTTGDAESLGLWVNGTDARQDLTAAFDPRRIFDRICLEIYRNRELLIKGESASSPEELRVQRDRALSNISTESLEADYMPSVKLCLNRRWRDEWTKEQEQRLDQDELVAIQKKFFEETGIPCKAPEIDSDSRLASGEYQVRINDVRLPKSESSADSVGQLVRDVEAAMLNDRVALFTRGAFNQLVLPVQRQWPYVYRQVAAHPGLDVVYEVLRSLVREGVRLVSVDRIFDTFTKPPRAQQADDRSFIVFGSNAEMAINKSADSPMSIGDWTRLIRSSLKREITSQYARPKGMGDYSANLHMAIYLLDLDLERTVYDKGIDDIEADVLEAILESVSDSSRPLIMTSETIKPSIWSVIERRLPHVTVLSWQELSPELNLDPISRIALLDD